MTTEFLEGDCLQVLPQLPAASYDSIITDPPAGISMLGEDWDNFDAPGIIAHKDFKAGATGEAHSHGLAGILAAQGAVKARAPFIAFIAKVFTEARRVLKPGAYGLVWALPRTSAWTTIGLEDAGFEIIDCLSHNFFNGFPKTRHSLKPGYEHWILIRNPVEGTIKANVAEYGTGYLQVDACRHGENGGRWPTNTVFSHSPSCELLGTKKVKYQKTVARPPDPDLQSGWGHKRQDGQVRHPTDADGFETIEDWACVDGCPIKELNRQFDQPGGAARFYPVFPGDADFFYCPKANQAERNAGCQDLYWKRVDDKWLACDLAEYSRLRNVEQAVRKGESLQLRQDMTPEEQQYVLAELKKAGVAL